MVKLRVMRTILPPATIYFAVIFALGFVLGTIRVLSVAPASGTVGAVLVELPVMLAASWAVARAVLPRWPLAGAGARLAMGALAFALLMAAEAALAVAGFGIAPGAWARGLASAAGAIGLAGQVGFAVMPVLVGRGSRE